MSEVAVEETVEMDLFYPGSKKKKALDIQYDFIPEPWQDKYFVKNIKGEEVKVYAVGALADALGVSTPAIRAWIRKGYIPQSPYRLPSNMVVQGEKVAGRRLYTREYIDAAVEVFRRNGVLGQTRILWSKHPNVSIEVLEAWQGINKRNKERNSDADTTN